MFLEFFTLKFFGKRIFGKYAFTLAEILMAVSIIGVVAAIAMPRAIENFQNMLYTAQIRKFYNELDGAVARYMSDEHISNLYDGSLKLTKKLAANKDQADYNATERHNILEYEKGYRESARAWANKYFDVVQDCDNSYGECFPKAYRAKAIMHACNSDSKGYPFQARTRAEALAAAGGNADTNTANNYGKCTYVFKIASGVTICMDTMPSATFKPGGHNDANGNVASYRAIGFQVDINGDKKPNIIGRDFFTMQVYPDGSIHDTLYESKKYGESKQEQNKAGRTNHNRPDEIVDWGCNEGEAYSNSAGHLGKLINNGWKMDYSNCAIQYDDKRMKEGLGSYNNCDWLRD